MKEFKIKKDRFKETRGSYSRLLNIHCRKCENLVAVYQKDGSGNLRRLYLDRIYSPANLTNLQTKSLKELQNLTCSNCKELLGTPYIYEKENRKAFRLYQDAVIKKIVKVG